MDAIQAEVSHRSHSETVEVALAEFTTAIAREPATGPDLLGRVFDAGLACVHFPAGSGGLGAPADLQDFVEERLRELSIENPYRRRGCGQALTAPILIAFGAPEQHLRYLRPIFTGEEIWCQLFSEPGAGSDLAGLSTTAVRDGDEWLVNGQKVWTTLAHEAAWGILVARTDPDVVKHRGLTYFIVDMHAPGVEVRPLRQITGAAEFNEVFLTDVRLPDGQRVGPVGGGWHITMTTLAHERARVGDDSAIAPINDALRLWREAADRPAADRDRLAGLWVRSEVVKALVARVSDSGLAGSHAAVLKLATTELQTQIYDFCIGLLGPQGILDGSDGISGVPTDGHSASLQEAFLWARALTIAGGTSEVLRNIVGERLLGLPAESRVDTDRPWSAVRR